jgi:hypothetical protein
MRTKLRKDGSKRGKVKNKEHERRNQKEINRG